MKTLIFNGSPKEKGDTETLVNALALDLSGEVMIVSHRDRIAPCSDCRYCRQNNGCSIQDKMQKVYPFLAICDVIVLVSPIWFSSLSGPLLSICSRIQTIYCANRFRNEKIQIKPKSGVLILVGAEKGTEQQPARNALTIMKFMNVDRAGVEKIYSMDTDIVPAESDADALARCLTVAELLNKRYE